MKEKSCEFHGAASLKIPGLACSGMDHLEKACRKVETDVPGLALAVFLPFEGFQLPYIKREGGVRVGLFIQLGLGYG